MHHILIVEDDPDIRQELKVLLENALYRVSCIEKFTDVDVQIADSGADLILLDVNLPGPDGMAVCRRLRERVSTPVIFVTSRNDAMDELNGMLMGGDDYVTKPYHAPILLARIAAVLKRTGGAAQKPGEENGQDPHRFLCGGCGLNLLTGTVEFKGKSEELTRNELRICYYLFSHKNEIVSRADLIEDLWENQIFVDDNTLSVNMTRIRNKLRNIGVEDLITTRRGQGYVCHEEQ